MLPTAMRYIVAISFMAFYYYFKEEGGRGVVIYFILFSGRGAVYGYPRCGEALLLKERRPETPVLIV